MRLSFAALWIVLAAGCAGMRSTPVTPVVTSYGYGGETDAGASAWNGYVGAAPTPHGASHEPAAPAPSAPLVLHHRGQRVEAPMDVPFGELHRVGTGYQLRWPRLILHRSPRLY
jgi:hypothetical protein